MIRRMNLFIMRCRRFVPSLDVVGRNGNAQCPLELALDTVIIVGCFDFSGIDRFVDRHLFKAFFCSVSLGYRLRPDNLHPGLAD